MFDDETPEDPSRAKIAKAIEKTAKHQHLTGSRRDTFTDAVSLCSTCRWAQVRRRASQNTRKMECAVFSGPCPEDISECTEYTAVNSLTLSQMADIAIIIDTAPQKRVGFNNG